MDESKSVAESLQVSSEAGTLKSALSSVQVLIDYLCLRKTGSLRSIRAYLWAVSNFCSWTRSSNWVQSQFPGKPCLSPDDLLLWPREELERLLQRHLDEICQRSRRRGLSTRYVNHVLACLKLFFRVNGFSRDYNNELRVQSYYQPARTRNVLQYVPTLAEACKMAERAGSIRNRAIMLTLFSSGLRNTALRSLLVSDIAKELNAEKENLLIKVDPIWNRRISGACKGSIPYYTFTSAKATQAIKEMLNRRKQAFNCVKQQEPLFVAGGTQKHRKKAFTSEVLHYIVKKAAREAGIEEWNHVSPHALRKVFESVLRSPTKEGGRLDTKDQEFLMGHILPGSEDSYYDWSKIDKLRGQFAQLMFEEEMTPEQETLRTHKQVANILGLDADRLKSDKEKILGRALLFREELEVLKNAIKLKTSPLREEREQRIVKKTELQACLSVGWRFVANINEESAIVERLNTKDDGSNDSLL